MDQFPWYNEMESEIRHLVWLLRNNGINTTGSCGHEGWILAETCSPFGDMETVCKVLVQNGYIACVILQAEILGSGIEYSLRIEKTVAQP